MRKASFSAARRFHRPIACGLLALSFVCAAPSPALSQVIQELRVQWTTSPPLPPGTLAGTLEPSVSQLFSLLDRRAITGRPPRQREPELNHDRMVIVARDAAGKILHWQVVADPRIVRAEAPGPGGELRGRIFYRERADFLFTLPDEPGIARIDFYQPRWTGAAFDLDLIGSTALQ
jgi:hypothetical protein